MIFFANAQGSITKIITEEVYQGSVGVNRVVLVAPYPASATVTVAFTLPNGIRTPENLALPNMTPIDLGELLTTNNGAKYNAWTYLLEEAITEYAGTLVAQFIVRDSASRKQTTFATSLTIQKGVAPILPETPSPTVYEEILEAFGLVNARLDQLEGMPLLIFVNDLPETDVNIHAIYSLEKNGIRSYYVYSIVTHDFVQIDKSVITTANSNAIVDNTKLYILTADSNGLSAGVYVVRNNKPLKLLTSEEYAEINNEIARVEGKADNAQSTANTANQTANTAVSTANSASSAAASAVTAAGKAKTDAESALSIAEDALNKVNNVTGGLILKGNVTSINDLPEPSAETLGFLYNVNDAFTTNEQFVEGAGISYSAGENVAIVEPTPGVYKYDVFSGVVDLSNYQEKLVSGQNIKTINGNSILGVGNIDINSIYLLSLVGDSGTLTTAENSALVAKYPQVMVKLNDVYTLLPVAKVDNMYYFQLVEIGEDEQGKYAGTMYVNINSTTRAWEFGEQYNDIPTGSGVPQYNLSTVLKAREEVTLDITDTMALFSILSDMNNLLKFQNIGVVIQAEEGSGHQPFIGLDIKPDYVENALIFSYQGVFYDIDLIAYPGAQVIKGKVMAKSQDKGTGVATIEISQTGASGLLDVDYIYLIEEKFPNVNIRVLGKYIYTALEFDATTNTYKFANVNTSDTQAETKLITVNANTNQWTATQYLADLGGSSGGDAIVDVAEFPGIQEAYALFNGERNTVVIDGTSLPINIIIKDAQTSIENPLPLIDDDFTKVDIYCVYQPVTFKWDDVSFIFDGASQAEVEAMLGITFPYSTHFICSLLDFWLPCVVLTLLASVPTVEITNPVNATQENIVYLIYVEAQNVNKNVFYRVQGAEIIASVVDVNSSGEQTTSYPVIVAKVFAELPEPATVQYAYIETPFDLLYNGTTYTNTSWLMSIPDKNNTSILLWAPAIPLNESIGRTSVFVTSIPETLEPSTTYYCVSKTISKSKIYYYNEGFNVLGGNSSGSKQKITLAELQEFLTNKSLKNNLISAVPKYTPMGNASISQEAISVIVTTAVAGGINLLTALNPITASASVGDSSSSLIVQAFNSSYVANIGIVSWSVQIFNTGDHSFVISVIDISTGTRTIHQLNELVSDTYFDFYIYK